MDYSICIIDDQLPANQVDEFDDTSLISSSMLSFLLNDNITWSEPPVKELVTQLLKSGDFSLIKSFTNPNFYFNYCEETTYSPEIVLFDWDYPDSENRESQLQKILESNFNLVFIFTGYDKIDEVKEVIKGEKFSDYRDRLYVKEKGEEDSVEQLLELVKSKTESNFSLKFGKELRSSSLNSVNTILVELGKVTLNQVKVFFKLSNDTTKDLIEFITERFKNQLVNSDFEALIEAKDEITGEDDYDEDIAIKLWSHRLYFNHESKDNLVKRGDIIFKEEEDLYYLIISGDCDLVRFWNSNYGHLTVVPLHKIVKENTELSDKLTLTRRPGEVKKDIYQHSITSRIQAKGVPEGPFILPFVNTKDGCQNFISFPKEVTNLYFKKPQGLSKKDLKYEKLKYTYLNDEFTYICSLSEPFLTPIIQQILSNISGYGVPDFPQSVKDIIRKENNIF